ncbi:MAG: glycosyltransferase [Bryobacteraceae bacterium]|nr:glycosyltransferase [Bryobacteraceae bacterium]
MRVLLFTTHYPATDAPLRGLYNQQAFAALGRHVEVRVVGATAWWKKRKRPKDLLIAQREDAFGLDASFPVMWSIPGMHSLHARATTLSVRRFVSRLRQEFPFDIMIASWAYPDCVAAASLAQTAGCPLISLVLGSDINDLGSREAIRPQIVWGLQQADRIVAVSHALAASVARLGIPHSRLRVQHNAVNGDRFAIRPKQEACSRLQLDGERPRIAFIGRLSEEKGASVLLDAIERLRKRPGTRDVELCLVGSGQLDAELRERARALGIESNVRFAGAQSHDEIPWWISACDVLCLPSFREGCPNVVLEALASGRPVVASGVGGIPELVSSSNGILVPAGDPAALSDGLQTAIGRHWDPRALRGSVEFLSWDAVARFYLSLIEEVLEGRQGAEQAQSVRMS